ncbi:hypothetical protein [Corallococcus sp. CA054B]|uniref:hypothetical protein n=1 Tax=Corallococcus sp. CA054B TaxID=2316734 RepID=UPI0011C353C1|nr:hypothetical protein [Corallococcus sp. CA054B]
MSSYYSVAPQPLPEQKKRPFWLIAAAVGILVGILLGVAFCSPSESTTTVNMTPCRNFIKSSYNLNSVQAQVRDLVSDGLKAISEGDYAESDRLTQKINDLEPEVQSAVDNYIRDRGACQEITG